MTGPDRQNDDESMRKFIGKIEALYKLAEDLGRLDPDALKETVAKKKINEVKEKSEVYVGLVDIIFAVIIGFSFVNPVNNILSMKYSIPTAFSSWFTAFTYLLVYTTMISNWVGYHRSIKAQPHQRPRRFFIDLIVLYIYVYFFIAINDRNFFEVSLILAVIYSLYWVWHIFRRREYAKVPRP